MSETAASLNLLNRKPVLVHCAERCYSVGFDILGDVASSIHVEVFWPDLQPDQSYRQQVLVCLPGGGMNLRYFDLGGEAQSHLSFARQMARRGYICVLVDPPGVGKSDRPVDGHALTPERIAQILARALAWVKSELQEGQVDAGLPPLPNVQTVGVGHSMGAMLTAIQQANYSQHAGLILMGFGTDGLPQFLPAEAKKLIAAGEDPREHLADLAKNTFPEPYPNMTGGSQAGLFAGANADFDAVEALQVAADVMLPVPAFMSMLPGNIAHECNQLAVPVFQILGDRDLVPAPENGQAVFPSSPSVTVQSLHETGHSHLLFPSRNQLFANLQDWLEDLNETSNTI